MLELLLQMHRQRGVCIDAISNQQLVLAKIGFLSNLRSQQSSNRALYTDSRSSSCTQTYFVSALSVLLGNDSVDCCTYLQGVRPRGSLRRLQKATGPLL